MRIVDLKKQMNFLKKYIELRNKFHHELLTDQVTLEQTKNWLANYDVTVLLAVEKEFVIGACILHAYRNGELSLFIEKQRTGIGTLLLQRLEKLAKRKKLSTVYAWVAESNMPSNNFFLKNGYSIKEKIYKEYKRKKNQGIIYHKTI